MLGEGRPDSSAARRGHQPAELRATPRARTMPRLPTAAVRLHQCFCCWPRDLTWTGNCDRLHQGCSGAGTRWYAVPANIVGHRWNANTEALIPAHHVVLVRLTLDQFIFWPKLLPNAGFGIKNLKKNSRPPPASTPSTATRRVRGRKLAPPLLGPRSRKPFPQIRIYHFTPVLHGQKGRRV